MGFLILRRTTASAATATTTAVAMAAAALAALGGCGSTSGPTIDSNVLARLQAEARPIGRGPRFQPRARGPILGACRPRLGPRIAIHLEVFAADRVVIVPSGIGVRAPLARSEGRITGARCYGAIVTLEPTGVVLVRPTPAVSLAGLFRTWGEPLTATRVASFQQPPGRRLAVYIGGRPWRGGPGSVPLTEHAEIVVEAGPFVPPHSSYTFPPGM